MSVVVHTAYSFIEINVKEWGLSSLQYWREEFSSFDQEWLIEIELQAATDFSILNDNNITTTYSVTKPDSLFCNLSPEH